MSSSPLEPLERLEYPGRVIIMGRDISGENDVVVYAITGRSPASQARELVRAGRDTIKTQVTIPEDVSTGNESLLIYNCIRTVGHGLVVSNGAQTDLIALTMRDMGGTGTPLSPMEILATAFGRPHLVAGVREGELLDLTSYEPDEPNFTPRISGCVMNGAALSIVRRAQDGSPRRRYFEVPLVPGKGKLIATYSGENCDPLPSFRGQPLDVELMGKTAQKVAEDVYQAMAPGDPGADFRVGAAVVFAQNKTRWWEVSIIDKHAGQK